MNSEESRSELKVENSPSERILGVLGVLGVNPEMSKSGVGKEKEGRGAESGVSPMELSAEATSDLDFGLSKSWSRHCMGVLSANLGVDVRGRSSGKPTVFVTADTKRGDGWNSGAAELFLLLYLAWCSPEDGGTSETIVFMADT